MLSGLMGAAVGLAAAVLGTVVALRAAVRGRRRPRPEPRGPRVGVSALRVRLQGLRDHGFTVDDDDGGDRIVLRLPLVEASSPAGRATEEYRTVLTLDEAGGTVRVAERRVSAGRGVGGAGLFRWAAWRAPTAGARDLTEMGRASTPGGSAGSYRLEASAARALVERTIAEAGWRVG